MMYIYAIPDKTYFDFISQLFSFVTLALLLDFVLKTKDKIYAGIIIVIMLNFLYAMGKQLAGVGTVVIKLDYVMWVLIPTALIGFLIIALLKAFKNGK